MSTSDPPAGSEETFDPPKDRGDPRATIRAETESVLLTEIRRAVQTELKAGMDSLRQEVANESRGLRQLMERKTDETLAANMATRRHVARLTTMTTELWRFNFGDKPSPPPPSGSDDQLAFALSETAPEAAAAARRSGKHSPAKDASTPKDPNASQGSVRARMDSTQGEIAELSGIVARVDSELQDVKRVGNETLALQKEQMGKKDPEKPKRSVLRTLVDTFVYAVTEREGQKFTLMLLSGIASVLGLSVYLFSLIAGHPPPGLNPPAGTYAPAPTLLPLGP